VTRRWTTRGGELDLIALDDEVLVFIEVKARSGRWDSPEEAVTDVKIERFVTAVESYCMQTGEAARPRRYDVVAIDDKGIRHYEDAFR
jgi:putative endonuclease